MRLTAIVLGFFLVVFSAVPVLAQVCTAGDQTTMDTCVGDAIDDCHSAAPTGCVRNVEEADTVLGLALEDCCCNSGAPVSGEEEFNSCKTTKRRSFKKARTLFSGAFRAKVRTSLRDMSFANCSFGCDF